MSTNTQRIPEGFKDQRLLILPRQVVLRLQEHPISQQLYPARMGHFPKAHGHYVTRNSPIDDHLLILCIHGSGMGSWGGNRFSVQAGQVALLPAGHAHHYESNTDDPWTICWLHLRGQLSQDYFNALQLDGANPVIQIHNMEDAREQFEALYGLTQGSYSDTTLLQLHSRLAYLLATLAYGRRESIPKKRDRAERIQRVIEFLNENLHRPVSIDEMASVANWTPNHFITAFREQINEPPAAYFLHIKMARASEELRNTDKSIESIARSLGYEDAFYFSRCYKRCYGMSPSKFRKADR